MSIRSTIFLLLILPLSAQAQFERLTNNKDIIWAAKVEAIVSFDVINGSLPSQLIETLPVKAIQDNPEAPLPEPFTEKLTRMIRQGAFPAYADKALQHPLTPAEARARMYATDTVVVFDPETYEEKIHIISSDLLGATPFFITQQLWLYNGKANELETIALSIAPAVESRGQAGEYQPLAWYKLPPPRKKLFNLKSSAVQFVTYTRYDISEEQIEVLKGKGNPLKEILIERFKAGELMGYNQKREPLEPASAQDIFIQKDTIITFDPETYEEKVQVVRLEFGPIDIADFRVQQNWFFAPSHTSLQCSTLAVGPAIPIIDEYGSQLALRPLFFWRRE